MKDKYTVIATRDGFIAGFELFKNGENCTFKDIVEDANAQMIILDLLSQVYHQGFMLGREQ